MKLFDVYPLNDITIAKGSGSYVWDEKGQEYLDFYGGHAVISIGHTHPHYVYRLTEQLNKIGFYSNFIKIPLQQELADKLGKISGKETERSDNSTAREFSADVVLVAGSPWSEAIPRREAA